MTKDWNASLYQSSHSFVWEYGRELLELLAPAPGQRILDIGCGTAQLTGEMARRGALPLGVDGSAAMIEKARQNFPDLRFEVHDVCEMPFQGEFDAAFSNAVLHWVHRADDAAAAISRALKPGGRFVAEFGGRGNVQIILDAVQRALEDRLGMKLETANVWYFPGIPEYSAILERHGFEVGFASLFDRPTALEGGEQGLATWLSMFGGPLPAELKDPEVVRLVERYAAPALLRDGAWSADYRRLRIVAQKVA